LEETLNRLRVELATLKSLARIEGKARTELGMVLPAHDQVRLAPEFVPVGTGLTSRAPLTAGAGPAPPRGPPAPRRPPPRTRHAGPREAQGSGAELASRSDGPRSSAGVAGAVCSRG